MLRDLLLIGKNLTMRIFVGQFPDQTADAERLFGAAGGSKFLTSIEKVLVGVEKVLVGVEKVLAGIGSIVMCFRRHNS